MLGLSYPGGPEIQKASDGGNPDYIDVPRPSVKNSEFNFSFSGLKTSLLYKLQKLNKLDVENNLKDIASSYQEAIVDTLLDRIERVALKNNINQVSIAGGVAANKRFREKSKILSENKNIDIYFPHLSLCTDNAGMIAMAGYSKLENNFNSDLSLEANPNLSL